MLLLVFIISDRKEILEANSLKINKFYKENYKDYKEYYKNYTKRSGTILDTILFFVEITCYYFVRLIDPKYICAHSAGDELYVFSWGNPIRTDGSVRSTSNKICSIFLQLFIILYSIVIILISVASAIFIVFWIFYAFVGHPPFLI